MTVPMARRRSARSGGFTLLELLISMSLFMVLGTALIALVTRAMGFLNSGTSGAELQDKGGDLLRPIIDDLENVVAVRSLAPGAPDIRIYCDFIPIKDDKGEVVYHAQRLAFVRATNREASDLIARKGGSRPGADKYFDGLEDAAEAEAGDLRALGGLTEVIYMAVPQKAPSKDEPAEPGMLTIYRGTRAPIGGKGSLLDPATVKSVEDLEKVAQPLMSGVLHFEVRFWAAGSTSWDEGFSGLGTSAPLMTWDSTRGVMPGGVELTEFPLARGEESLKDPRDDISPRMVRVTCVVERTGRDAGGGRLLAPIDDSESKIYVFPDTAFATSSSQSFIKLGTEWIQYSDRLDDRFDALKRGARNTIAQDHEAEEPVRAGYAVAATVQIPSYREDWNFR